MAISSIILVMVLCLIAEGFFSGSEIAIVSADNMRLRHEAAKGSRGAQLALKMLEKPEWLLATTLIGTNISVVTNTTMATALMINLFGENGSWFAVLLVAPLIWVFGEIVPKSIFQQRADELTPYVIFPLKGASYLFYPILLVFTFLTKMLSRILGDQEKNPFTLREEIMTMMNMSVESPSGIQSAEKDMISRMFGFSETTAEQIMVPLIDVVAVEKNISCGKAMKVAVKKAYKRLPVYDERVDQIVGILDAFELLDRGARRPIADLIRPVRYVPESKSIKDLLIEFRLDGDSIAVVVDEFGGAEGIVFMEDIMEEIVQEMSDEYHSDERQTEKIAKNADRDYTVDARIDLDDLVSQLKIDMGNQHRSATLSGYLLEHLHTIPHTGQHFEIRGIKYTILKSTPQTIDVVKIHW